MQHRNSISYGAIPVYLSYSNRILQQTNFSVVGCHMVEGVEEKQWEMMVVVVPLISNGLSYGRGCRRKQWEMMIVVVPLISSGLSYGRGCRRKIVGNDGSCCADNQQWAVIWWRVSKKIVGNDGPCCAVNQQWAVIWSRVSKTNSGK